MIQEQSYLEVADNSGARKLMCIRVLGGSRKKFARVGDIIKVSIKEVRIKVNQQVPTIPQVKIIQQSQIIPQVKIIQQSQIILQVEIIQQAPIILQVPMIQQVPMIPETIVIRIVKL